MYVLTFLCTSWHFFVRLDISLYVLTFLCTSLCCSAVSLRVYSFIFVYIGDKHLGLRNKTFVLQMSTESSLRDNGHVLSFAIKTLLLFSCSNNYVVWSSVIKDIRRILNYQYDPWNTCGARGVMLSCYFVQISSRIQPHRIVVVSRWVSVFCGSLSPRHGASSQGWGWRNGLRYGGQLRIHWISIRGQPTRGGPPAWGFGRGVNNSSQWKKEMLCNIHMRDESGRLWVR
jgi:hypothetical protein